MAFAFARTASRTTEEHMMAHHAKHTVLVPILGDDISDDTFAKATSLLARPDSHLVLLHIRPADDVRADCRIEPATVAEPRWHRLASAIPADRTFIDAVAGDPTTEILAEADRFHPDAILV
jgi:nucleotide-binding universal stress UspA family protein